MTHNWIDYVLAPRQLKSGIIRAKSRIFQGVEIHRGHDFVVKTMKLKLKKNLQKQRQKLKFNLEELKDPRVADLFVATIGGGANLQHLTCWKRT